MLRLGNVEFVNCLIMSINFESKKLMEIRVKATFYTTFGAFFFSFTTKKLTICPYY